MTEREWGVREPDGTVVVDRDWKCPADVMRATHGRNYHGPIDVVYREWTSLPDIERLPVKVHPGGEAPRRGYPNDAGLDLIVSAPMAIAPGQFVDVPCGVSVQLPAWAWGLITGRSSTLRKRGLMVNPGIIDTGYRGPLFAGVWNMTAQVVEVKKGERIAQLIVIENSTRHLDVRPVKDLEPSDRGHNGFGSTGA